MKRKSSISRKSRETNIKVRLSLDGTGKNHIDTGVAFLDHMLILFTRHGLFDLELKAQGDLKVDEHHTVEDCGLSLGEAILKSLGKRKGIKRFSCVSVPMDEALAKVSLDLSGRPNFFLRFSENISTRDTKHPQIRTARIFLKALSVKAGLTLHVDVMYGEDAHHIAEAIFKALGLVLDQATIIDKRARDIPSTKGRF